jgi:hypothetical protein
VARSDFIEHLIAHQMNKKGLGRSHLIGCLKCFSSVEVDDKCFFFFLVV